MKRTHFLKLPRRGEEKTAKFKSPMFLC
jgi:hypothetical protein